MQLAWLTDIHLNFIDNNARHCFYQSIINTRCDGVLITGDIAEATDVQALLIEMADFTEKPIYFVLGNHDYYHGQIDEVRNHMRALTQSHRHLFWLPVSGVQKLNQNTFLIGQDGWADGRLGDYQNSRVMMNDARMIVDLFQEKIMGKIQLLKKMQQLADADAMCLEKTLVQAIAEKPQKIIVLTHVPPFKEVCFHKGKNSSDDWLPFFASKVMGEILLKIASENPEVDFLVLCGHTHSGAEFRPLKNIIVKVGDAEYYQPKIQEILEF